MEDLSVSKLSIRQFRSYSDVELHFGRITFIVGRNSAGKSNLIDALALISEIASEPLVTALDRRGGITSVRRRIGGRGAPAEMVLGIETLSNGLQGFYRVWIKGTKAHGFRVDAENCGVEGPDGLLWTKRRNNDLNSDVDGVNPRVSDDALFLPLIGGVPEYREFVGAISRIKAYAIDPLRMKEAQVSDDGAWLKADGSNSASVVRELKKSDRWQTLLGFLQAAIPQIEDVEHKREGAKVALQFRQKGVRSEFSLFPGYQASDGTLRLLGILLALFQNPAPTLTVIEEPEVHLHPGALAVILDAIEYASKSAQIVVTTQSPELLDAGWIQPEDIWLVEWMDDASKVSSLSEGASEVVRRHLRTPGELLRSGALEASG